MRLYFCVKNFAKIEEARVNINNFTVFIGSNNSGKTKLMELIYGVLHRITLLCPDVKIEFTTPKVEVNVEEIKLLVNYVNDFLYKNKKEIIYSIFNQNIPIKEMYIEVEEIDCLYDVYYITEANLDVLIDMSLFNKEELQRIVQGISSMNQIVIIKRNMEDNQVVQKKCTGASTKIPLNILVPIIMGEVLQSFLGLEPVLGEDMLFLPASRMGLMLLYKEYFGKQSDDKTELIRSKNQQNQQLTRPVMDFLSFLLNYSYSERCMKEHFDVIDFINNNLIDGRLNENGEITTYSPKNENVEIPLFLSSSMINELDPIVKMLTDNKKYSFLFYDEVETSLHPLKQVELVKLLNRLNNKGIKILLSTHSEAFVNKMNNLLLLSHIYGNAEEKLSLCDGKIEITREDLLKSGDIHVYQFTNRNDGKSVVKELEFRKVPNVGYTFELFEDSANALYEESKVALGIEEC